MRAAVVHGFGLRRRRQRLLMDVDDGTLQYRGDFLGEQGVILCSDRRDSAALHPPRWRRHLHGDPLRVRHSHDDPLRLQCGPLTQVGSEHDLEVGSQRCEFGTKCGHLVSGLRPQFSRQLTAQMGFHCEFVFPAGCHLPIQL